jgi:hypothetical protein
VPGAAADEAPVVAGRSDLLLVLLWLPLLLLWCWLVLLLLVTGTTQVSITRLRRSGNPSPGLLRLLWRSELSWSSLYQSEPLLGC